MFSFWPRKRRIVPGCSGSLSQERISWGWVFAERDEECWIPLIGMTFGFLAILKICFCFRVLQPIQESVSIVHKRTYQLVDAWEGHAAQLRLHETCVCLLSMCFRQDLKKKRKHFWNDILGVKNPPPSFLDDSQLRCFIESQELQEVHGCGSTGEELQSLLKSGSLLGYKNPKGFNP